MKILYVISDRNIGGAGILLCNILRHIDRKKIQCTVALPFGSELRSRMLELKIPVRELQYPCDRYLCASVRELMGVIHRDSPDVVHANAALCARIAGKLCGKKVVHTRHCCFPVAQEKSPVLNCAKRLGNRLLSDRVIATAEAAALNLVQLGIPRKKIEVILNGSEPVREVSAEECEKVREQLQLTNEDYCVGICARLEACKGHSAFLHAAAMAKKRMPYRNFRFLIVGEGSQRTNLERLAEQLGIADCVRFTGFVRDMAPIYRILRINVNCSCGTETSCLAISEGMSAGLPTVASNYGGNPAMLGTEEAGICFPVGNAEALADAVCRIASDAGLEGRMREEACKRYQKCYTAERMTRRLSNVYASLI